MIVTVDFISLNNVGTVQFAIKAKGNLQRLIQAVAQSSANDACKTSGEPSLGNMKRSKQERLRRYIEINGTKVLPP